jgi:hypothetical protein
MSFVAAPLQQVLVANARGGLNLLLDGARLVLVCGAALGARQAGMDAVSSVLAMSGAMAVVYGLTILAGLWSARRWDREAIQRAEPRQGRMALDSAGDGDGA